MRETTPKTKTKKIMDISLTTVIIGIGVTVGSVMLAVIGFFLIRLVNSIDKMGSDISDIKVSIGSMSEKHDSFEKEQEDLKKRIEIIYNKVFA